MRPHFFILFMLALCAYLPANGQQNKVEGPLKDFVNTPFMLKFKDLKIEAEAAVRRFKLQSHELAPGDVQKVQTGYEQSAYRFNQLLSNIKTDFLNPKKVKYISEFPEDYQRSLELELHQLTEFYALHFLQPLADATGQQMDGSPALLLVVELVGLTKGLIQFFSQSRQQARRFNEAYLQQNLYRPFHFLGWDEIGPEGSMMPSPAEEVIEPNLMEPPSLDPLLQEATQLLTPTQQGYNSYDGANTYDEYIEQSDTSYSPEETPQDTITTLNTGMKTTPATARETPAGGKIAPETLPQSPKKENGSAKNAGEMPAVKKKGNNQ
ncbi:MAG: hypothetical protein H6562_15170 [Lewinellaceae bacterium]|nr:hypothetical protein [Lewinellaceae bacterium]